MQKPFDGTPDDLAYLRSTRAIRERSAALFDRVRRGESEHFSFDEEQLSGCAELVASVAREAPHSDTPHRHGRLKHFGAGGVPRTTALEERIANEDRVERARIKFDLLLPSVLIDAGAGESWSFDENGKRFVRSEGLAVASFRWFMEGGLAKDRRTLRTDAEVLLGLHDEEVASAFQVTRDNELVGLGGRAAMLRRLGAALGGPGRNARPGDLLDEILDRSRDGCVSAESVLSLLLERLATVWPARVTLRGENLGDTWVHPALGQGVGALVPFHKLTQWLTQSLVEPIEEAGLRVTGLDALTGLADYRNGGLFVDTGVLGLKHETTATRSHLPDDELVVEWRALTIALFDELGRRLRSLAQTTPGALEDATWLAGRRIALEKRASGVPPITVISDGTVF